jgi:DNA modification methylase
MSVRIIHGDCREVLPTLPADSFDCVVTSPPYFGLRDYGVEGQIGREPTLALYLETTVCVFREVRRVLKPDGTCWLNIGDSYANDTKWGGSTGGKHAAGLHGESGVGRQKVKTGLKSKDLMMVPNRLAILLQDDGWYVRSEIIWHKLNPTPESVADRPTSAHEKIWLLTKSARYFYDAEAIAEDRICDRVGRILDRGEQGYATQRGGPSGNADRSQSGGYPRSPRKRGLPPRHAQYPESSDQSGLDQVGRGEVRNARNVWSIASEPYRGAHYAVMPSALAGRCIKAGCPDGGSVLDPFAGAGTTGLVADRLGRNATLIELNPATRELSADRVRMDGPLFAEVSP